MSADARSSRRLAGFLIGAGALHFVAPSFYDQMIPPQLPGSARSWVTGSGLTEIAVGTAVGLPRTRRRGALAAVWLFVCVFPGNVQMLRDARRDHRPWFEQLVLAARLPLQIPLVVWAEKVRRATVVESSA